MGRKLQNKQPSDAAGPGCEHAGCVWGLLHLLKYHHWHYVKKRLMYKKRGNNKNGSGVGNCGNCGNACTFRNVQEANNTKMDKTTTEVKTSPVTPAAKTSVKARIKARFTGETAKKGGRHNRSSSCPLQSELQRTESIHHRELSSNLDPIAEIVLNEASPRNVNNEISSHEEPTSSGNDNNEESSPMNFTEDYTLSHDQVNENQKDHTLSQEHLCNDAMIDMLDKKLIHVKELDEDSSVHHPKEYLEALDIINVNKELLVKVLHDPGSPLAQQFHNQQAVRARMSLYKSESFPTLTSSGKCKCGSEPIELRQNHASKDGSAARKPTWSTSMKYAGERSMPSINDSNGDIPSSTANQSLKRQDENSVARKRFKDLRQKIKHVSKESDQERHVISMDAILHKIPHGQKLTKQLEKEIVSHSKDPALQRNASDHSVSSLKKNKQRHIRRISSLDASLDKYRRLYETTSFNNEDKCHTSSERLKIRTEQAGSPFQNSPVRKFDRSLGRIFSLPEMESYVYQNEESPDGFPTTVLFKSGMDSHPSRRSRFGEQKMLNLSIGSENELQLDFLADSESRENLADVSETNTVTRDKVEPTSVANDETSSNVGLVVDENEELAAVDTVSHAEQDTEPSIEVATNVADPFPVSVPDFSAPQSEGEELELKHEDGLRDLDNKQEKEPDIDTSNVVGSELDTQEVEIPSKHSCYDMTHVHVNERDMLQFNYVRDVLEFSGFSGNESIGTWHSDDQPLYPVLYDGTEGCFVHDPDCAGNEKDGECDHVLLFDLINEVLMEIYGRSYNYCPRALTSLCYIRLMSSGHQVLKEVWSLISWYLSLRPEFDQSMDYVVRSDLAKNDGWMNLQFDSECIGLELEDLIFDDLLEEVIWVF